jgi:hypothetical protein
MRFFKTILLVLKAKSIIFIGANALKIVFALFFLR